MTENKAGSCLVIALCLLMTLNFALGSESTDVLDEMTSISQEKSLSNEHRLQRLKNAYARIQNMLDGIEERTTPDLQVMFTASDMLSSYSGTYGDERVDEYVNDMAITYAELRRRSENTPKTDLRMFSTYVSVWKLNEAAALKKSSAALFGTEVPKLSVDDSFLEGHPAELVISENGEELILRKVEMDIPFRIIVVSGCRISEDATREINHSKRVRDAFRNGHAVWLTPASKALDIRQVKEWNREFPNQEMSISYRNSDWGEIDFSLIPTFHFYKNGKLVAVHRGWAKEGIPDAIIGILSNMGLLPTDDEH